MKPALLPLLTTFQRSDAGPRDPLLHTQGAAPAVIALAPGRAVPLPPLRVQGREAAPGLSAALWQL